MKIRTSTTGRTAAIGVAFAAAILTMPVANAAEADSPPVQQGASWVSEPIMPTFKTVDMAALPRAPEWRPGDPIIEIPRGFEGDVSRPAPEPANPVFGEDVLALKQRNHPIAGGSRAFGTPVQNFNAIASPSVSPNDPTGDIGPLQFVASINSSGGAIFAVYNKATGALISGPTTMESLGSGGPCAQGLGDPIVLFDEAANRWVFTEFVDGANNLCVYISNTADLSGSVTWTRYVFLPPAFPDYPKYGVWPDAYYVGANEGGTPGRIPFYAMDRVRMLAGQAATMQRLTVPILSGFGFQLVQPADVSGIDQPAAGTPGLFMRHNDDEAHTPGTANPTQDFVQLFEFRVNWTTPANSTITGPISFAMPEFSSNLNGLSAFQAFPQPNSTRLDPLREPVMHRLVYRRFEDYEVLVGNLVTDLFLGTGSVYPNDTGAVRWFELRRSTATSPPAELFASGFEDVPGQWTLYQTGTYAPADGTPAEQADRWMGGINVDAAGNIGMAYNVVRQTPAISTSVRYTGRLASDPLGVMTQPEVVAVAGSGSVGSIRWGDYNDMGVDPVDGCTFWFIGNYVLSNARANRVTAFRHDDCGAPTFSMQLSPTSASVCANTAAPTNATPVTLSLAPRFGFNAAVAVSFPGLPTGVSGSATPASVGTQPGNTTLQLAATNAVPPGTTNVVVRATSGAITKDRTIPLVVWSATPGAPTLIAPANAATAVSVTPTFSWSGMPQTAQSVVEASTSNGFGTTLFSQVVSNANSLVSPVTLPAGTQIFWRVRGVNACATGSNSTVFSFTTAP